MTTRTSKRQQTKNLDTLIKAVKTGEVPIFDNGVKPVRFDMAYIFSEKGEPTDGAEWDSLSFGKTCGTAACIVGYAQLITGRYIDSIDDEGLFGIPPEDWATLTVPDGFQEKPKSEALARLAAVKQLRRVKNGKDIDPDWFINALSKAKQKEIAKKRAEYSTWW